jgi:hypothetical protein
MRQQFSCFTSNRWSKVHPVGRAFFKFPLLIFFGYSFSYTFVPFTICGHFLPIPLPPQRQSMVEVLEEEEEFNNVYSHQQEIAENQLLLF